MGKYDYYFSKKKRRDSYEPIPSYDLRWAKKLGVFIYMLTGALAFILAVTCLLGEGLTAVINVY